MSYINHLITPRSITIVCSDKNILVNSNNKNYEEVKHHLLSNRFEDAIQTANPFAELKFSTNGKFHANYNLGKVIYTEDNSSLPDVLSNRLMDFINNDIDTTALEAFWHNCRKNPDQESIKDLYEFLEYNSVPITRDGCFIAYKRVRKDFKDFYTGKFDNSPGKVVQEDRSLCNSDRNETCSRGLHCAAWDYANESYYSGQGYIVEVKVNPEDVVSVPVDYDRQKMRTCKYTVVKVCGGENRSILYTDDDSYTNVENDKESNVESESSDIDNTCDRYTLGDLIVSKDGRIRLPRKWLDEITKNNNLIIESVTGLKSIFVISAKSGKASFVMECVRSKDDRSLRITKNAINDALGSYKVSPGDKVTAELIEFDDESAIELSF